MNNPARINAALQLLLEQAAEAKPWVIIENTSGKFVQFAGSTSKPLLLDLPWQPLSEVEFYRAVTYFKRLGVTGDYQAMFDLEGNKAAPQFTFFMTFHSAVTATEAVLSIFEKVYSLPPDTELVITTSWGAWA